MGFDRYGSHTFYFYYELERGEETIEVEVTYGVEDGDLWIEDVQFEGRSIETTPEEDKAMLELAHERVSDDMVDAESGYGDYLYEMRRDAEG